MKKTVTVNSLIAAGLIAAAVLLRILPHPANFAPITSVAIFGGAVLPRRLAIWTPLAAVMVSDVILGFYNTILVNWACYALIALASSYWLRKRGLGKTAGFTMASSLFFFAISNFAVWVWSGMYAHTFSGLGECFAMALPFFRNTAFSDLVFTGALFGTYHLSVLLSRKVLLARPQNT